MRYKPVTNTTERETAVARPTRSLKAYAGLTLRGMAMGASDIVPGVSGGTMAFILGIYEELIDSIRTIGRPEFLSAALRLRIRQALQILNWPFLLAVGLGIFISVLTLSGLLEWLLVNQPVYIWSFFFGLVLASAFTVSKRIPHWTVPLILTTLAGAAAAYLLVGMVPAQTPNTWWFLILSGALASCAMILPGISGAFILVILGKYAFILNAVNTRDLVSIGLLGIGAAIGLISFAQVLSWMFKQHHNLTVAVLIGLMLGSLRKIWPWQIAIGDGHGAETTSQHINILPSLATSADVLQVVAAVALMITGIVAIVVLDRVANLKEQVAEG
ncbi:MAG: DUF368 domain-containing protein [Chloroflexi bacterium]|nr:DUF368 domain-containing protein [Chloroflexota bacterium]